MSKYDNLQIFPNPFVKTYSHKQTLSRNQFAGFAHFWKLTIILVISRTNYERSPKQLVLYFKLLLNKKRVMDLRKALQEMLGFGDSISYNNKTANFGLMIFQIS